MKLTVIPIVIGTLSIVIKGLIQGLSDLEMWGRVETIQTTALLRSARILRRVLETCCHSKSIDKPSTNAGLKNSQKSKVIIPMGYITELDELIYAEAKLLCDKIGVLLKTWSEILNPDEKLGKRDG